MSNAPLLVIDNLSKYFNVVCHLTVFSVPLTYWLAS